MRYGEGLLEEILRRTDLVRLVGRRVKLVRRGRAFWGLCPFHKEKSPSFKVENERNNYKCFGCGAGGDAFRWLMETEGVAFPEAVERLAQEAGVELPKRNPRDEAVEIAKKSLCEIVESACVFFEEQLRGASGAAARAYLLSRGLGDDAWRQFRLGFAPAGRKLLIGHLAGKGISLENSAAAGLARLAEGETPARDFFFDRITFPIADVRGRIVAFGARALTADAKPKYINTGETALFSKGRLLYNYRLAREAALKSGGLVVAEGYLDVIALVRAGFEAAVAPLGTALTADHLALLWRVAPEPVLAFDGDAAGQRAACRAADLALPLLKPGHSLRFAFLPPSDDPDSLIRAQGAAAMRAVLDNAMPLVEMLWNTEAEGGALDTPERKAALIARLNERLQTIPAGDLRRFYMDAFAGRISARLGLAAQIRNDRLHASAFALKKTAERPQTLRRGFVAVSPALMRSRLVPRHATGSSPQAPGGQEFHMGARRAPVESARSLTGSIGEDNRSARFVKEAEIMAILIESPVLIERQQEMLAALPLGDRRLDTLRHELLNVAASGFRLETGRLEGHLVRAGMGDLVERLRPRRVLGSADSDLARKGTDAGTSDVGEAEVRWLRAAAQLREMAEADPERTRALERFKAEASEESWRDWQRLVLSRGFTGE
ncbi:MAG TPA: DNA primase [Rhizomicrobium sp.]|jgi:DNA primase